MSVLSNVHQSARDAILLACEGYGVHYSRNDMGPLSRNGITPSETDIKNALAELVKEGFLTEEADGTYSITYTGIQQRIKIIQKKP